MSGIGSPGVSRNCIINARIRVGISFLERYVNRVVLSEYSSSRTASFRKVQAWE